jgi:hypothetical protein
MKKGSYPWYDAQADRVRPVWPPRPPKLDWLERLLRSLNLSGLATAGSVMAYGLALVALAILVAVLVMLWRIYQPGALDFESGARRTGLAARIEGLPPGLKPETEDPWAEAQQCRARGDYARAVVCLFIHQVLTLDRLRQLRLVPGKTARQLVAGVDDRQLREWVSATARLFEAVYYGQRIPSAAAFEPVWSAAEAFERQIAEGLAR